MNPKIKEKLMKDFWGKWGIDLSIIMWKWPKAEAEMWDTREMGEKNGSTLMKYIVEVWPMLTPEETIQAIHMLSMWKDVKYNEQMWGEGMWLPSKPELDIDGMLAGWVLPPV